MTDARWRLSGPSVNPPGGDFGHNYGPHFPLKVYYSPEMVDWLCNGRNGEIPDGAIMIKAMSLFSVEIGGVKIKLVDTTVASDGCMDLGQDITPILWAPMIKSHQSSYDGWMWMLQQVTFPSVPLNFLRLSSTNPHSRCLCRPPSWTIHPGIPRAASWKNQRHPT